jgi:hypothetical protein
MQKNHGLLIGFGAVVLLGVLAVGWYLASPLFIDNSVDEAFPFERPSEVEFAQMPEAEKMEMEKEFMEAIPDEAELAAMSQEEMAEVEDAAQAAAVVVMSDKAMDDPTPEAPETWTAVATGTFIGADDFHQGEGTATIYQLEDERVLRFEAFSVTNGPDLRVILSSSPNPTARDGLGDYIDLGMLKGNIGSQNYEIPADVDLSLYQSIVIYCQPFHVVFATAVLN